MSHHITDISEISSFWSMNFFVYMCYVTISGMLWKKSLLMEERALMTHYRNSTTRVYCDELVSLQGHGYRVNYLSISDSETAVWLKKSPTYLQQSHRSFVIETYLQVNFCVNPQTTCRWEAGGSPYIRFWTRRVTFLLILSWALTVFFCLFHYCD